MSEAVRSQSIGAEDTTIELHQLGSSNTSSGSILVIPDHRCSADEAANLAQFFAKDFHLYVFGGNLPSAAECFEYGEKLASHLESIKAKRLTVVGVGAGSALAQALVLADRSIIRRLALVDGFASPAKASKNLLQRAAEMFLPAGLPLHPTKGALDLRPHLHRLRPPTLLLLTKQPATIVAADAPLMLERIPNCRQTTLRQPLYTDTGALGLEFSKLLREFMEVPVKRSQKGTSAE
ncbi:MAG: hypothetical protein U0136_18645 [Bdellovibrionota bacterium]